MRTQQYYDEFAAWYERERGRGYHRLIDDLEVDLAARYAKGAAVLEAGCGTGLILARLADTAAEAWGCDISAGMLARARERGLRVVQASVTELPFPDERFDVVASFKVLPHVERIREACSEMARVTRPHGYMLLEFYNPFSLRYLVKALKKPTPVSETTRDSEVFTRYDTVEAIRTYLPRNVRIVNLRGVRIATAISHLHKLPILGTALGGLEKALADAPLFRRLGGFIVVVCQKD